MSTLTAIGMGCQFKIGNAASPEVFTAVAEVTGITGPGYSRDAVDATHTDSPGQRREFLPGLSDEGEFSISLNFASASYTVLNGEKAKTTPTNYQVVFPTSPTVTWTFAGFITALEATAGDIGDVMSATATFKITSVPTLS